MKKTILITQFKNLNNNLKLIEKQQYIIQKDINFLFNQINKIKNYNEFSLVGLNDIDDKVIELKDKQNLMQTDITFLKDKLPKVDSHVMRIFRHMINQERENRKEVDI